MRLLLHADLELSLNDLKKDKLKENKLMEKNNQKHKGDGNIESPIMIIGESRFRGRKN